MNEPLMQGNDPEYRAKIAKIVKAADERAINQFRIGDRAQIRNDADYIRPEFHGMRGKIMGFFQGDFGNERVIFKLDIPYDNPVFSSSQSCIVIGPDLLARILEGREL